jgi:hypothetical protein
VTNRVPFQPGPEVGAIATVQLDGVEVRGKVVAIDADGTGLTIQIPVLEQDSVGLYLGGAWRVT